MQKLFYNVESSAGASPTFWTHGLASLGLAGTRGLASPIEEVLSFKTSFGESTSLLKAGFGLASPTLNRESLESRVPIHSSSRKSDKLAT